MTATTRLFVDEFDRPDGPLDATGARWTEGHDEFPEYFEPLGIVSEKVHCTNGRSRSGAPYAEGVGSYPPPDGKLLPAISCAWRDTGSVAVRAMVRWCGNSGISEGTHMEATPLIHVTPGTTRFGFGVWPSEVLGVKVLIAGYIGGPPETFEVVDTAQFAHTDDTERDLEIRSDGTNATVYLDGVLVTTWATNGTNIPLDPDLASSTLHGFAVDGHATDPTLVTSLPFLTRCEIEVSDDIGWLGNEGDTVVGSLTVDPGTNGRIELGAVGGVPAVLLYATDANTDPVLSFGSFLGSPLLGLGSGAAAADAFLARGGAGIIASSINGVGQFQGGFLQTINAQTGTSYTTALVDRAYIITRNNGSASTHDWPSNATAAIPIGTIIHVINLGAGTVTHQAGSGATLVTGSTTSQAQGVRITAIKTATNQWSLT